MLRTARVAQPAVSLLRKVLAAAAWDCELAGAGEAGRAARQGSARAPVVRQPVVRQPVVWRQVTRRPAVTGRAAVAGEAGLPRRAGGPGGAMDPGNARAPGFRSCRASNAPGAEVPGRHCRVARPHDLKPGGREPGDLRRQRPPPGLAPPALTRLVLLALMHPVQPLTMPGRDGELRRGPLASR